MFPEDKKAPLCVHFTTYATTLEYSKVQKTFLTTSHERPSRQNREHQLIPTHILFIRFLDAIQTETP